MDKPRSITNLYDHGIITEVSEEKADSGAKIYMWIVKQYDKLFQSGYRPTQAEAMAACEECLPVILMPPPSLPAILGNPEDGWRESGPQCWVRDKMIVTRFKDRVLSTVNIHASVTMTGPVSDAKKGMELAEAMQARWEKAVPKMREAFEKEAEKYGFSIFIQEPSSVDIDGDDVA